jgi:glycosyltransferase involved in cell wall biosynthesis
VRTLVHTEHGRRSPDPFGDRFFDALAARRTDVVVAVSERLAADLPRALRISASKVVCIPNGVDTDLYRPRPDSGKLRSELGLGAETTIIGSIGRLEPIKRYDGMLAAFAAFTATDAGRDSHLVIGGDGTTRGDLEQQAGRLGVTSRVHLLGWRDDIHDLLSSFALFTMSSQSEGTSISLLEAMSAGVPPVVTDVGGNRAVLGAGLAGGLVAFGDASALAGAWADTLRSSAERSRRSGLARQHVVESFSAASAAAGYESVYLRLSRA